MTVREAAPLVSVYWQLLARSSGIKIPPCTVRFWNPHCLPSSVQYQSEKGTLLPLFSRNLYPYYGNCRARRPRRAGFREIPNRIQTGAALTGRSRGRTGSCAAPALL